MFCLVGRNTTTCVFHLQQQMSGVGGTTQGDHTCLGILLSIFEQRIDDATQYPLVGVEGEIIVNRCLACILRQKSRSMTFQGPRQPSS